MDYGLQAFCCFYAKILAGRKYWVAPNMEGLAVNVATHPSNNLNCGGESHVIEEKTGGVALTAAIILVAIGQLVIDCAKAYAIIKKANHPG